MRTLTSLLILMLTTACGLIPPQAPVTVKELLPVGATLQLTRTVEVPAGRRFVYIQHGVTVPFKPYNSVNIYVPYCQLMLEESASQTHPIEADRFRVTGVVEYEDYVGRRLHGEQYASLDLADARFSGFLGLGGSTDGGPGIIMYATIIGLESVRQPEVKEMVCGHWDDYGVVKPLTLEEFKSALGDLVVIKG
ncbi:MAG: hypothetical protein HUJ29_09995 [Gammaproteobacteria bacterium]|nr:hypothetical protein [Gammaproteobacteria bacterium]